FNDVRVRRAMSLAIDRQGILDAVAEGFGAPNPPVPAALKEWSIPMAQLGEGARWYRYDPAEAKRLLAQAGYPNGFPGSVCFTTYGSTILRSEEHTSELQSRFDLVCRLLLEKKN